MGIDPDWFYRSALIVVDMQRYFVDRDGRAFIDPPAHLKMNLRAVVDAFRCLDRPIIYTRHIHKTAEPLGQMGRWWGGRLPLEYDCDAELSDDIGFLEGDLMIVKDRYSAFKGTELDIILKRKCAESAVICGVMTNLCVESTARDAFMLDLQPIIVEDACAANRSENHRASILNLSYGFAHIYTTDQLIAELGRPSE